MKHTSDTDPQFFITHPQTCAYLSNRLERKIFTKLEPENGEFLNNTLSKQGFRRSQNILYRPACKGCTACFSSRIDVSKFQKSKSQKRVINKNRQVARSIKNPWATEEQYDLFKKYLNYRHIDGGMAGMEIYEFSAMIEETSIKSKVIEYYSNKLYSDPVLIGASLTDILDDGISMVYSFYDPELKQNSFGKYIILDHIEYAKQLGLPYVYLGYWVPNSEKMGYKSDFSGIEIFSDGVWQPLDTDCKLKLEPDQPEPITKQVANLKLPSNFLEI